MFHAPPRPYGAPPTPVGEHELPEWQEFMHYLYLPVAMPGQPGLRLPDRLQFLRMIIKRALGFETMWRDTPAWRGDHYVYVTARRGFASPGNALNRPGWHADGFGSEDVNYIWSDRWPTRFALGEFATESGPISEDHVRSAEQFEERIAAYSSIKVRSALPNTLHRLDPAVVHATPIIDGEGGMRSFLKVSISRERYNLLGNSHNHLFDYDWRMWSREEVRNHPAYAGGDAGPQEEAVPS